jgi:site-specific DNA recombinase
MTSHIRAALYARVSSDQQAKAATIDSQIAALKQRVATDGHALNDNLVFVDDGYSGTTLVRPALERLRDLAYTGGLDVLYVASPDRLARKYAYQVLLLDEFRKAGINVVFLNHSSGKSPEDELLLQVQGVIAEYERAMILERARRGKRHAARHGSLSVMGTAPFGYRYVPKTANQPAQYHVELEEARLVRQIFEWVGLHGLSLRQVALRLTQMGIKTRTGLATWNPGTIAAMLRNTSYKGQAQFGKKRAMERQTPTPWTRARKLAAGHKRQAVSYRRTSPEEQETLIVPAIVSAELFDAVAARLTENQKRNRERREGSHYLLQGLLVCERCGYAYTGRQSGELRDGGRIRHFYYRCCGQDKCRRGEPARCDNGSLRMDAVDAAVWKDVCDLLRDPGRIRQEYERRASGEDRKTSEDVRESSDAVQKTKRAISRLLDAYETGILSKEELEPRIKANKERLARQEAEAAAVAEQQVRQEEMRQAIGRLEDFADQIKKGLNRIDATSKREILRALVKQIEVGHDEVRIVYRISQRPFVLGPSDGATLQHRQSHQGRVDSRNPSRFPLGA